MKTRAVGVCYYPEHWPEDLWPDDAARMREAGISHVRIAEFAWSRLEPARGRIDWAWLENAIEVLANEDLNIILCTPTATPPKWLVNEMPDMIAVDRDGRPRTFGSRRHYSFSHEGYLAECRRITENIATHFGQHPAIVAWQTDNEYGCHDTTISYCAAARNGFRNWLAQKYQSPEALNRAWGNVFWSMEIAEFDEIELPNLTVTEANPSHWLDFRQYSSDAVVAFNRQQVDILRRLSPGRDIVHNFMGKTLDFDHFAVADDLDVASWDSYPIGFLEQFGRDNAWKNWYARSGDPDFQAFHHDLYRGCGKGRWWVMEQQPGPVNWAPWNPDPHPGMVRLWSHEAFAHGAELVSYFRWRQPPFAQEQMHTALNRSDNSPDRGMEEAKTVAREIANLPDKGSAPAPVAILFDYASHWASTTQPQGEDFDGFTLVLDCYSTLRQLGQSIDIVDSDTDLTPYRVIVIPHMLIARENLVEKLASCNAEILFGPRFGSRTEHHAIPDNLPPGPLQKIFPFKVTRVESLRPAMRVVHEDGGYFHRWFEHVECSDEVSISGKTSDGHPALISLRNLSYCTGWPDETALMRMMRALLGRAGMTVEETGDDLRLRDSGNLRTIVNYGPKSRDASHLIGPHDTILLGGATMPVAGVTIVKRGTE